MDWLHGELFLFSSSHVKSLFPPPLTTLCPPVSILLDYLLVKSMCLQVLKRAVTYQYIRQWHPHISYTKLSVWIKGRERNRPSLLSPPGPGSVRLCNATSPTLLASCEIADSHPNQTICPRRNCCQVLAEIAGQSCTSFSNRGEKSTPYIVNLHSTHI